LIVPAKTPAAAIKKMSSDLDRVMADADTQSKLRSRGLEPAYLDPVQTGELMRRDVARWREVTNRIQLSLD
jgi:tripartite-type tricarboxylate transporter receptor subunit TctC